MRCPHCKERATRDNADSVAILTRRLVVRKSDGQVMIACHACNKPFAPPTDLADILRKAVLLETRSPHAA